MTRILRPLSAVAIALTFGLAACSPNQSSGDQTQQKQSASSAPSSSVAQQYHAALSLKGSPVISTDGNNIVVTITVANTGESAFGTDISPSVNVNLGAHSIDATGTIIDQDLARGTLPHIAPSASATATILLPTDKVLNKSVQILPVVEGVAWFDKWGTKPLVVGPFNSCSSSAAGTVCDAAGKPLSTAATQP